MQAGTDPLEGCEGAFDALALLAVSIPRVVAIFGVQGWCWAWAREVRELIFALDADAAGQQQWRQLARQAALRGKQVAVLEPAAYGGQKDVSAAWAAGVLEVGHGRVEAWEERVAIMMADGGLQREEAERLAGGGWEVQGERHAMIAPAREGTTAR